MTTQPDRPQPAQQITARVTKSLLIITLLIAGANLSRADEPASSETPEKPDIETITVRLLITNPEGEPIAGATVTPSGMRTRLERGSHYGWAEERHGKLPKAKTGESGTVEIACPKFVYEKLEVGEVTWLVQHEDYIMFREDRSIDDDPAKITLQRGRRIAVTAIDADTKEPIRKNLHASLSGSGGPDEWATLKNGMLMSRGVDPKRNTLRVFTLPEKGPAKFSKSIDLNEHGNERRVLLREIELQTGTRVEGTLAEKVQRPIKNGVATIHVITGLGEELYGPYESRNEWSDWATINEDGEFVFESLPRGDVVQMIAVCDGWVCTHPSAEDLQSVGMGAFESQNSDSRVAPQVALLNGDVITPVIDMQQTASCRVNVLDPEGKPLEGAMVHTNPNQIFFGGGSNIVGDGYSLRAALLAADQTKDMTWGRGTRDRYVKLGIMSPFSQRYLVTTDEKGVAELHTLPGGTEESPHMGRVSVHHEDFEQPTGDGQGIRRQLNVPLVRGETSEVTIKMQKKGTTVIGE